MSELEFLLFKLELVFFVLAMVTFCFGGKFWQENFGRKILPDIKVGEMATNVDFLNCRFLNMVVLLLKHSTAG